MANRIDCTKNESETFSDLIMNLERYGFEADHFHAVDLVELDLGIFNPLNPEHLAITVGQEIKFYEKEIIHLNLVWKTDSATLVRTVVDAEWDRGHHGEKHPLSQDPKGFFSLVADGFFLISFIRNP